MTLSNRGTSHNHAKKLRQKANKQKRGVESTAVAAISVGPTPIGGGLLAAVDCVDPLGGQDSKSLIRPVLGLQSVGEMVAEGYQFEFDGSGNTKITRTTAQSVGTATIGAIPIGTISTALLENGGIADHQVPSCDWCGDECYTLQCGVAICVSATNASKGGFDWAGAACADNLLVLESTLQQLRRMNSANLVAPRFPTTTTTNGA